jgi:hypothetical protein
MATRNRMPTTEDTLEVLASSESSVIAIIKFIDENESDFI